MICFGHCRPWLALQLLLASVWGQNFLVHELVGRRVVGGSVAEPLVVRGHDPAQWVPHAHPSRQIASRIAIEEKQNIYNSEIVNMYLIARKRAKNNHV